MRLTIVPDDRTVILDGVARTVDCSSILPEIHAVQWYGATGEVEFKVDADGIQHPNAIVTEITPFQSVIDLWVAAAPPPVPTQEQQAITGRAALFIADPGRADLLSRLQTATPSQINDYVDAAVTDIASARTLLKRILLLMAK